MLNKNDEKRENYQCQKCLNFGHWTYECKHKSSYLYRPSINTTFKTLKEKGLFQKGELKKEKKDEEENKKDKEEDKKDEEENKKESDEESIPEYNISNFNLRNSKKNHYLTNREYRANKKQEKSSRFKKIEKEQKKIKNK